MDDFDDALEEFNRIHQTLADRVQTYEANPQAPSSKSTLDSAKSDLRRLKTALAALKEEQGKLSPVDAVKGRPKVADAEKRYNSAEARLNSAQAAAAVAAPAKEASKAQLVAKSAMEANLRLKDTNRVAAETVEIGDSIVNKLESQTDQMRGISQKAQRVEAHARKGQKLTAQMLKLERIVNGVLWGLSVLFLALSALAFWVFHHNVAPSDPVEPEPVEPSGGVVMGILGGLATASARLGAAF